MSFSSSPQPLPDLNDETDDLEAPRGLAFMLRAVRMDPALLGRLKDDQIIQILHDTSAETARLQALQLRAIANLNTRRRDSETSAEIALELSITEKWAANMISAAEALTGRLPRTLGLMDKGKLDLYRAMKVSDATTWLSDENAGIVDVRLETRLPGKNATQVRKSATYEAGKMDPDGVLRRTEKHHGDRRIRLHHGVAGTSHVSFSNVLSEKAMAAYRRIDQTARALKTSDEPRTLDQLRTDVAIDLLLSGNGGDEARAEVLVYIDLATYLGLNDESAELAGHGPIPAALARRIASGPDTALRRIITDPLTGQVKELGENRYRPSEEMTEFVRVRDRECRHPGCVRPAQTCAVENTASALEDGTGEPVSYCPRHRKLKNRPAWQYEVAPDGTLTVTTPSERTHKSAVPSLHPPRRRGKRRGSASKHEKRATR